jgi:hypothetical protein
MRFSFGKSVSYWFLVRHTSTGELPECRRSCSSRSTSIFSGRAGELRRWVEANASNNATRQFGFRHLTSKHYGGGSNSDA